MIDVNIEYSIWSTYTIHTIHIIYSLIYLWYMVIILNISIVTCNSLCIYDFGYICICTKVIHNTWGYWHYFKDHDLGFVFRVDRDHTVHVAGVRPGSPASRLGISHSWRLLVAQQQFKRVKARWERGWSIADTTFSTGHPAGFLADTDMRRNIRSQLLPSKVINGKHVKADTATEPADEFPCPDLADRTKNIQKLYSQMWYVMCVYTYFIVMYQSIQTYRLIDRSNRQIRHIDPMDR